MASPSPYGSFIRCLMSVYPDAFGASYIPEVSAMFLAGVPHRVMVSSPTQSSVLITHLVAAV